jgi:uncharacterized protein (DUF983 family)
MSNFSWSGRTNQLEPIYYVNSIHSKVPSYVTIKSKSNKSQCLPAGKSTNCGTWKCSNWDDCSCASIPLCDINYVPVNSHRDNQDCVSDGSWFGCICTSYGISNCTHTPDKFCTINGALDIGKVAITSGNILNEYEGVVPCIFNFKFEEDFSSEKSLIILSKALKGLYQKNMVLCFETSPSKDEELGYRSIEFRNFNIVYAIILDFYNQLYRSEIDFLDMSKIDDMRSYILVQYETNTNLIETYCARNEDCSGITPTFSFDCIPKSEKKSCKYPSKCLNRLLSSVKALIKEPQVDYIDNNFRFIFDMSYLQYKSLYGTKVPVKDNVQFFLNNFFKDEKGKLIKDGKTYVPENAEFDLVSIDINISTMGYEGMSVDIMKDEKYKSEIIKSTDIEEQYYFTTATVTVNVKKWSPMLLLYFNNKNTSLEYSVSMCQNIFTDTNIVPSSCLEQSCNRSKEECVNDTKKYCPNTYIFPDFINNITQSGKIVSKDSGNCKCYYTKLLPVSRLDKDSSHKYGICFSSDCDGSDTSLFGVTPLDCIKGCSEVDLWVNSSDPMERSQRASLLSKEKFDAICGKNYKSPYNPPVYNIYVAILGVIISVGFVLEIYRTNLKIWLKIVIVLIFLCIYIYLIFDLAGRGMCSVNKNNNVEYICQSKISKINIPIDFCEGPILECECIGRKNECSGNCQCVDSVCFPPSGKREYKTQEYKKLNLIHIILCVTSIFIGITLLTTFKLSSVHKIIIFVCMIMSLIFTIISYNTKKYKRVFSSPCS